MLQPREQNSRGHPELLFPATYSEPCPALLFLYTAFPALIPQHSWIGEVKFTTFRKTHDCGDYVDILLGPLLVPKTAKQ